MNWKDLTYKKKGAIIGAFGGMLIAMLHIIFSCNSTYSLTGKLCSNSFEWYLFILNLLTFIPRYLAHFSGFDELYSLVNMLATRTPPELVFLSLTIFYIIFGVLIGWSIDKIKSKKGDSVLIKENKLQHIEQPVLENTVDNERNYLKIFFGILCGIGVSVLGYFIGKLLVGFYIIYMDIDIVLVGHLFYIFYLILPFLMTFGLFKILKNNGDFKKGLKLSLILPILFFGIMFSSYVYSVSLDMYGNNYYQKAMDNMDSSYCDKVPDVKRQSTLPNYTPTSRSEECYENVRLKTNDYYYQQAIDNKDISYCDNIVGAGDYHKNSCRRNIESGEYLPQPMSTCENKYDCRIWLD